MSNEQQEIRIDIDDKTAAGTYSNLAVISHTENEVVMDFIFVHPPKGRVNSRIVMSPAHAKKFFKALKENIEIYEKNFGGIKDIPEPPKMGIDFSKN